MNWLRVSDIKSSFPEFESFHFFNRLKKAQIGGGRAAASSQGSTCGAARSVFPAQPTPLKNRLFKSVASTYSAISPWADAGGLFSAALSAAHQAANKQYHQPCGKPRFARALPQARQQRCGPFGPGGRRGKNKKSLLTTSPRNKSSVKKSGSRFAPQARLYLT